MRINEITINKDGSKTELFHYDLLKNGAVFIDLIDDSGESYGTIAITRKSIWGNVWENKSADFQWTPYRE